MQNSESRESIPDEVGDARKSVLATINHILSIRDLRCSTRERLCRCFFFTMNNNFSFRLMIVNFSAFQVFSMKLENSLWISQRIASFESALCYQRWSPKCEAKWPETMTRRVETSLADIERRFVFSSWLRESYWQRKTFDNRRVCFYSINEDSYHRSHSSLKKSLVCADLWHFRPVGEQSKYLRFFS